MSDIVKSPTARRQWSGERVIAAIQSRAQASLPLNPQTLLHDAPSLLAAGRRYFGSWPGALRAAGVRAEGRAPAPHRHRRGHWNRERIIQEIQHHAKAGRALHAHAMQAHANDLVSAATYHFGSWRQALEASGFDPTHIQASRRHSPDSVVKEIQALMQVDQDLRDVAIRRHYRPLYWASQKYFGSWKHALQQASERLNSP